MNSPKSSESRNDMAHYEGSNETLGYNLLSDIQQNLVTLQEEMKRPDEIINEKNSENADLLHRCVVSETSAEAADDLREQCEDKTHQIETLEVKTSQEKEIEKLQRELNIKNENLVTLQEEMKRRDEIINEKNSENADLLHRCVVSETSAEAADDLREQCEDKNHQIETLEGDLASVRNENESLKRHLEEIENVAADHQRLIDENKSLNGQIKKAIEEKEELGAQLASRNENNSDLLSNYLEMKKKEEELAAELKKMQENYQYEKRRSEELSGQLSLKNKEVTTTENKYKQEMEELIAKYKNEKDQAEKEKELLKQRVTKLTEGSQQLQAENKRIKDDLQVKSMECGNLKSERLRFTAEDADLLQICIASETSAGDLASVRNENESLKRHLEEIENVAADHQRLIDENKSLNEYLEQERQSSAALKEEAQALKEQITNKEDVLKELESQIKKAIEEKEELGAKLASRNENNSDLISNYLEMKKKEEEMAAELKKMQENYQYEKRRSEELSGQLSLKNKEVTTTENKYKQEMEELKAKYKTEKDQAEKEKELLKQRVTKLTEGSQQLQAENKRIKDDLQLKSMECGNLKSERLRFTGELDAAKKEIAELSNDRDKLGAYITTVNDEVRQLRAALELKEAEKNAANECMQKVVREKQEMMYSMGNLQRIELENHQLKHQNMDQSEQITKLHASLQEYGLLRDHIQEYYKAFQDSQMELQREKEKSRHINELLSKTGYRLDSMASELNNYRTMTEGYRRSLEEEKEKSNKLEQRFDRLTIDNEKLKEERDKCEQKSFEYRDECSSLPENLEKSQAECRDLLSKTQEGPSDGTTSLLQGNFHFTSTPMGNGFGNPSSQSKFVLGFGNPSSQSKFVLGIGRDKMNRKK
ncbi:girdin-like isoform X1 [Crassostrea angulata]|uniref:girdin-like isoform X1 n=1 Tax=Magallana angulata TaxID=2784310 RepID=UPI0022B20AF8|nr:girdin-like isoform X1 [Crassostrea angulata]